jgi:signal transduction histidine kinase
MLVTLVAFVLSGLNLNTLVNSLSDNAIERSRLASQQVYTFVLDHVNQHSRDYPAQASIEETKAVWREIVQGDKDISTILVQTLGAAFGRPGESENLEIVEINVADQDGTILTSSDPDRVGKKLNRLQDFTAWRALPFYRRLINVLSTRIRYYQTSVPVGVNGQPLFTIQVVASSVLLRSALMPQMQTLALISIGALLISLLLTTLATGGMLRPLGRIEQTIDRIAQGKFAGEDGPLSSGEVKEFAAVESKLNLLGQQYRGAQRETTHLKHSLDEVVDRMASQLDVASRLSAISRITGGVAHEIKNPLNAISLRLDLLRARVENTGEDELIPEIDILSKEVRRLDRVVKTFLDFSRPVDVSFAEVDLGKIASEVANLMTPPAKLAGVDVKTDTPTEPTLMRGDSDLLKQAILNLVTNALEALRDEAARASAGGQAPKQGLLRITVRPDRDQLILEVADNGPGIPDNVREKVFQLYFTTKEKGSGIGLAMTYRAVQLHNGTVDFVSEKGRGTTFRIQFPAQLRVGTDAARASEGRPKSQLGLDL